MRTMNIITYIKCNSSWAWVGCWYVWRSIHAPAGTGVRHKRRTLKSFYRQEEEVSGDLPLWDLADAICAEHSSNFICSYACWYIWVRWIRKLTNDTNTSEAISNNSTGKVGGTRQQTCWISVPSRGNIVSCWLSWISSNRFGVTLMWLISMILSALWESEDLVCDTWPCGVALDIPLIEVEALFGVLVVFVRPTCITSRRNNIKNYVSSRHSDTNTENSKNRQRIHWQVYCSE